MSWICNLTRSDIRVAKIRHQRRLAAPEQRRQKALAIAQEATQLLKTAFAVKRVVVFGSLLAQIFHETVDVD